jgi:hypothetical protein
MLNEWTNFSLDEVLSYEEAKEGVSRYIEEPLREKGELTNWDLSFEGYIEGHKNSRLIFCRYGKNVGIVFSPADHHGIWAAQREGTLSKGIRAGPLGDLSWGSGQEQRSSLILEFIFRHPASESARSGHQLSRGGFTGIVRIDILEPKLLAAGDAIRRYKLLGPFDDFFIFHLFG